MKKQNQSQNNSWLKKLQKFVQHGDHPWRVILIVFSVLVTVIVIAVGLMLWLDSKDARIALGLDFLLPTSDPNWNPITDEFNAWPFIYGTLLTSILAIVIAVPISLGIAIFMAELCPEWLKLPINWLVELLAAIPSVVYGLWGIFVFLPVVVNPIATLLYNAFSHIPVLGVFFAGPPPANGATRLGAAFILTIMIIPTITAVTRDVLLAIPDNQREASLALGSTKWESIWKVLLPYGLSGILGAVILGLGRALGETMAVTMVIGNSIEGSLSILRPGYTMASIIANEFAEAVSQMHSEVLIEVGMILFFMTLFLNMIARFLVWQVARRTPQEARV